MDLDGKIRHIPSFSDAEEQCEDEYDQLLEVIHEDELFAPVDIARFLRTLHRDQAVQAVGQALPENWTRRADMEIRVNGKGIVGDAIRRPNLLYRLLLGVLPF